jgi:hypothetical protein
LVSPSWRDSSVRSRWRLCYLKARNHAPERVKAGTLGSRWPISSVTALLRLLGRRTLEVHRNAVPNLDDTAALLSG